MVIGVPQLVMWDALIYFFSAYPVQLFGLVFGICLVIAISLMFAWKYSKSKKGAIK